VAARPPEPAWTSRCGTCASCSRGAESIARRLTYAEAEVFERERGDADAGMPARLVVKEEERFRRPRRGVSQR